MQNMETIQARVRKVEIKERRVRIETPTGEPMYELEQVGTVTLEFDAVRVDVTALARLVGQEGSEIGFNTTQLRLER